MAVTGEGSAKLLLFGEHAAVYGHPAVGLALPWTTRVTIAEDASATAWNLPKMMPDERTRLFALVSLMFEIFPRLRREGYSLTIDSNVPRGMGFGSSSALCVALVKAVVTVMANRFLPEAWARELLKSMHKLWLLANRAERLFHGKPSGIDTGLALLGDMQGFRFSDSATLPEPTEIPDCDLVLVVGGVPRDGTTKEHVQALAARRAASDAATIASLDHLGALSREALAVFENGGDVASTIGRLANEAEQELVALGLGNNNVTRLLEAGLDAGALGGKTSGAGCGGAFFLVAPDLATAGRIKKTILARMDALGLDTAPVSLVRRSGRETVIVSQ